jgi:hypothetical protein
MSSSHLGSTPPKALSKGFTLIVNSLGLGARTALKGNSHQRCPAHKEAKEAPETGLPSAPALSRKLREETTEFTSLSCVWEDQILPINLPFYLKWQLWGLTYKDFCLCVFSLFSFSFLVLRSLCCSRSFGSFCYLSQP